MAPPVPGAAPVAESSALPNAAAQTAAPVLSGGLARRMRAVLAGLLRKRAAKPTKRPKPAKPGKPARKARAKPAAKRGAPAKDPGWAFTAPLLLAAGRTRLAVGLLWQLRVPGLSLQEQAREVGSALDELDLVALHSSGRQLGFALSADGRRRGMKAAATLLGKAGLGESWLAAFSVPVAYGSKSTGWWIVAQRDGLIYEDRFCPDEAEAFATFSDAAGAPDWGRLFCPPEWGFAEARPLALHKVLSARGAGSALRPVSQIQHWAPRVLLGLAIAGFLSGVLYSGLQWRELQREFDEQTRRAQEAARLAAAQVLPWEARPLLDAFVRSCALEMNKLFVPITGWATQPLVCEAQRGGAVVRAGWRAEGGRAYMLRAALHHAGLEPPALAGGAREASIERQITLPVRPDPRTVRPLQPSAIEARLTRRFDTLGLDNITMRARITPVTAFSLIGEPQLVFNHHELTIISSTPVDDYVRLISDMPAVVPVSLRYNPENWEWTLVLQIYHPPLGGPR